MTATTPEAAYAEWGRPIRGPQALTRDPRRFWHLAFNIARTEWKLRFFGSVLGYVWQLMRPLLLFTVLWIFFTKVGHVGEQRQSGPGQPNHQYGVQLLGSIVLFTFFAEATVGAVSSVVNSEALVRKIQFPRMVIPVAIVLGALFNLGLNLLVVLGFALISGVRPMVSWLEVPLIVAMLAIFASGVAMLLSSLYVRFRDVAPIWDVVTQALFYASPVIVPLVTIQANISPTLLKVYMLSPLATCFEQFRHAAINHAAPGAAAILGFDGLAGVVVIVLGVFALGFVVFNRNAPYVAENL